MKPVEVQAAAAGGGVPGQDGPALAVLAMRGSGGRALAAALERCGARVVLHRTLQGLAGAVLADSCAASVHLVRAPHGVARALQDACGLEATEVRVLWEAFNARCEEVSVGIPRLSLPYAELAEAPVRRLRQLVDELAALGIGGLHVPADVDSIGDLLALAPDTDTDACGLQRGPARAAEALAVPRWRAGEAAAQDDASEVLRRTLQEREAQLASLRLKLKEQAKEIGILDQRVAWLDAQVLELQASTSWRITAPLRSVSGAMRKARRALGPPRGPGFLRRPAAPGARPRSVLAGEDSFVLYRIIGNDLYPRHKRGQSIENLRFILEHEPVLEGCEKRFVLNRLLDAGQEEEIIGLLAGAGFEYFRIPFDAAEYAGVGFDVDALPDPGLLSDERFDALDEAARGRLMAALYRCKNNYVMNNNGARNAALEDGRGRAKWILPWDGNCFLTREAWAQIRRDVAGAPGNRYFTVPMSRVPSNAVLVSGAAVPRPVEEPQVIFRSDAAERFNEAFCYGRRPKVELLWRLAVKGVWEDYTDDPWDQPRAPVSPDAGAIGRAGWVARLSSGMATLEAPSAQAPLHRGLVRTGAILATLQHLDAGLSGMAAERPVWIRPDVLRQEKKAAGDQPALAGLLEALERAAQDAELQPPSGAEEMFDQVCQLALEWAFNGESRYAERGLALLLRAFVDPATRLDPRSVGAGTAGAGIESTVGLHHCLDAVRLFESGGCVGPACRAGLRGWLEERLDWLLESEEGRAVRRAQDRRGTCYDLQIATIASFLDDQDLVYTSLVRAQSRVGIQFAANGSQPGEDGNGSVGTGACRNMQAWVDLAGLASRWGVDLWRYQARSGGGLAQGARWLLARAEGGTWPDGVDADRLQPIRFAAAEAVDGLPGVGWWPASVYEARPVFPPGSGVRPFWSLASYGGRPPAVG